MLEVMMLLLLSPSVAVVLAGVQGFVSVEFLRIRYEVGYRKHTLTVMLDIARRGVCGTALTRAELRLLAMTIRLCEAGQLLLCVMMLLSLRCRHQGCIVGARSRVGGIGHRVRTVRLVKNLRYGSCVLKHEHIELLL